MIALLLAIMMSMNLNGRQVVWQPNPGPQTQFLATSAMEALYGGAAGGGKSSALLAEPLRFVHEPTFAGLLLRRTFPELKKTLIPKSQVLYKSAFPQARYNSSDHVWTFPSGAKIFFGFMENDNDRFKYQSTEFQYLGFDELTHFTRVQYEYMFTRARSSAGVPIEFRAGTNPGGEGHEWVFKRWGPWLDPKSAVQALPGQVLWYLSEPDGETTKDVWVPKGTPGAQSRTFIPARVEDNPSLMKNDPGYVLRLQGQDKITREQLLNGNWLVKPSAGLLFKRAWFGETISRASVPVKGTWIRYWDRAATENDGDWTRGLLLCWHESILYVVHMSSTQSRPHGVEQLVKSKASDDGLHVRVGIERDPGAAGIAEGDAYVRLLAGYDVRLYPVTKDKVTRAKGVSAQAEGKNVKVVKGDWNEAFFAELEAFPEGDHDDIVDSLSGGFTALAGNPLATFEQTDVGRSIAGEFAPTSKQEHSLTGGW